MLIDYLPKLPDLVWIVTVLVLTLLFTQHVFAVRSFPPGPFPLPVLGNLLAFVGKNSLPQTLVPKWRKKYGDVFTIWFGPRPTVMVCGMDLIRQVLVIKRNDFAGRVKRNSMKILFCGAEDVIMSDFGPCWHTLKKTMLSAVRKYSVSQELADTIADTVDEIIEEMLQEKKPVDARNYTFLIVFNILLASTLGKRFSADDEDYILLKNSHNEIVRNVDQGLPSDFLPFLSYFYNEREQLLRDSVTTFTRVLGAYYEDHKKTYQKGLVRDYIDSVIAAREEALEESKETAEYFSEKNVINLIHDMITAASDNMYISLCWILLRISNSPEIRRRMLEEIDNNIGSRPAILSDRDNCPYISAVIMEVLRRDLPIDFTAEHKSICNSEIGGYKIPKDTSVLIHIKSSHYDQNIWDNPDDFRPERFLNSDGNLLTAKMPGYMPFSLGSRGCPGEKLATADLFLIVIRILQKLDFQLAGGSGSANFEPEVYSIFNKTKPYSLNIKRRS